MIHFELVIGLQDNLIYIKWCSLAYGAASGRDVTLALQRPYFSYLLRHNSDFGRSGRARRQGRICFGSFQNPGWSAVRSAAGHVRHL